MSPIASCGVAVRSETFRMVRSAGVFFGGGVVVMGTIRFTMLHPQGPENLKLPPPLEAASPSSEDSSRTVCKDGGPLCTIPTNTTSESFP
jgi:hypothetical protein